MPYLGELITRREFQLKWVSNRRYEVLEYIANDGARTLVGTVFIGKGIYAERDANLYIGSRLGGLSLINGKVVDSKLADLYSKAGASVV
jgi:hypothetical protein